MSTSKLKDIKFQFNDFVKRIGNQVHVANIELNRNDFKSYKELSKEENKPFQPIRPRVALMRADKQSRENVESKYKAKIHEIQKKASQIIINPEQEKANREDKEEWMLDLQEIYDKIHEELQKLIKNQQQPSGKLTPEQAKKFKDLLDRQMLETETMMSRLQMPDKKSIQNREGVLIAKQFRQSLKDLYTIMQSVEITQIQKIFAQNFEYVRKLRQLRSKQLLKEIRNSTERLEKVRIGNNLENILSKQKVQYEKSKLSERSKKLNEYLKLRQKYPYDDDIRFEELGYFINNNEKSIEIQQILSDFDKAEEQISKKFEEKGLQQQKDLEIQQLDQKVRSPKKEIDKLLKLNEELALQNEIALTAAKFDNQRQKVEQMVEKINNLEGCHVDFDHKYKHIGRYFHERKNLSQLYLGETRLTKFLKDYENKCKEIDENKKMRQSEIRDQVKSMDSLNLNDIDFNQEIEVIGGPSQNFAYPTSVVGGGESSLQKNEPTALQKLMKINVEIQQKLLEEEHEEKMNQIKKLGVEQNQNFWDQLLEKQHKNKRFVQQKAQTSHGSRPVRKQMNLPNQHETNFKQKTDQKIQSTKSLSHFYLTEPLLIQEKERQLWLEKQQKLILNAHHRNPILKIAFSQNKQLHYTEQNNFVTVPVNNLDYLVRREYSKTSEVKKRSSLPDKQSLLNKNNDDNFKSTFFSNFYLFQDNTATTPHSSLSNTNYTIRYPSTANQKERPNKWIKNE